MFAHSCNSAGSRHDLVAHLSAVAELAQEFAAGFGGGDAAYYAGLWHDVGKFNPAFQEYLRRCESNPQARGSGPDHKGAGAVLAFDHCAPISLLMHGHHGGLRSLTETKNWVAERRGDAAVQRAIVDARRAISDLEPSVDIAMPTTAIGNELSAELYLRLLFSALVDADWLDTESHFDPGVSSERTPPDVSLGALWERFLDNQHAMPHRAGSVVDDARNAVYDSAVMAAERDSGVFRLTVPTGGGKTRSAMAFALRHAMKHDLQRVIVATPYTSITDQTAKVYREIFGTDAHGRDIVLEHHSQATEWGEVDTEGDFHPAQNRARLAAENWDAPIIVTTTVQLFESLFSNRTSRIRKAHRLARSVIILDEAQTLPLRLLDPIMDAIRQLTTWGRTTVVLSTATQPAFEALKPFADLNPTEIVAHPERWFAKLRRVKYEWHVDTSMPWEDAAQLLRDEGQGLAIVNLKRDALNLLDVLDDPTALHLSTNLCGAHRRQVIGEVRERLGRSEPCRLVSTQVVEAGVDLDFPFVMRAMGPLDAIIQAAGRCNREGSLERGRVLVFLPEGAGTPPGTYRTAAGVARAVLGGGADLDDPAVAREYFRRLYDTLETDVMEVQKRRQVFDFPEVARRFRTIDDDTEGVVIETYGNDAERERVRSYISRLRGGEINRYLLRKLQPYTVSLYAQKANNLRSRGLIEPLADGVGVWHGGYDDVRGLLETGVDPDDLVV